jgi:Arrestin (or S-antigen), C-terminal domain/Arrestin (or S-antigen), N-terminal domain
MDDYKEVTTALEGRLSLKSTKGLKRESTAEDYFETRPETRATVNSWLSGRMVTDYTADKSDDVKDPGRPNSIPGTGFRSVRRPGNEIVSTKANVPQVSKTTSADDAFSVTVKLAEPNLYLEGYDFQHRSVHRSAVLRGLLRLHVKSKVVLDRLSLNFEGISETVWPESWRLRHLKKHTRESITSHTWNFLQNDQLATSDAPPTQRSFEPGYYNYNFELPLDSSLPETIELPLGAVYYLLTATASEAGRLTQSSTHTQTVNLIRIPCACSLETVEPCGATGFHHGLRYSFMMHAQSFSVGGQVPLSIRLVPQPDCSWQRISISIEEDVRYRTRDGLAQREQSRCMATLLDKRDKQDDLAQRALRRISAAGESMTSTYAGTARIEKPRRPSLRSQDEDGSLREKFVLQLPSCSRLQPDTAYSCLYIRHNLVITVLARIGLEENNHKHFQIRIRLPIQLLTCKLSEGTTRLPEYAEDAISVRPKDQLCRCTSKSKDSDSLQEVDEQEDDEAANGNQSLALVYSQEPPAYRDLPSPT